MRCRKPSGSRWIRTPGCSKITRTRLDRSQVLRTEVGQSLKKENINSKTVRSSGESMKFWNLRRCALWRRCENQSINWLFVSASFRQRLTGQYMKCSASLSVMLRWIGFTLSRRFYSLYYLPETLVLCLFKDGRCLFFLVEWSDCSVVGRF